MAYDKVVDSAVLDAGLKQIADAIREKGGTSDNLAFPQAMADAIAAIEAGGGGGGGLDFLNEVFNSTEIQAGTCTIAETSASATTFAFDKPFNAKPNYYLIFEISPPPDVTQSRVIMNMAYSGKNNTSKNAYNVILSGKNYNPQSGASLGAYSGYTNTTFSIVGNSSYPILAGTTYGWIVLKGEF